MQRGVKGSLIHPHSSLESMKGLRRDPQAILLAHQMDPLRLELYVEGVEDQILIKWMVGDSISPNARVLSIDTVNMPCETSGGNRGRLITFASLIEGERVNIRFFADADSDRLLSVSLPSNVVLTDLRDLEGYWFNENCLDKLLRLSLHEERFEARQLLRRILSIGRILGFLRLISDEEGLNLPFQKTDIWRSLNCSNGEIDLELDLKRYVNHLLQRAGRSIKDTRDIIVRIEEKLKAMESIPDHEIVHGKDAICLLDKILAVNGVNRGNAFRILSTSFERSYVSEYPNLREVVEYLS